MALSQIKIFHTDRGNEIKNQIIDETLETFEIEQSLIMKGYSNDNVLAETAYKVIKTEFLKNKRFQTIEQLGHKFVDYVNWYNNHRINSSLGYFSPVEIVKIPLKSYLV